MVLEIKIPGVGESVQEAILAQWYKQNGDLVNKDELLFVIETDKVTLEIEAEADGVLKILVQEGETVAIGAVVGTIDTDAAIPESEEPVVKVKEEVTVAVEALPPLQPETKEVPEETAIPSVQKILAPSVRRLVAEKNLNGKDIPGTGPGGRITKGDVLLYLEKTPADLDAKPQIPPSVPTPDTRWTDEAQTRRDRRIADAFARHRRGVGSWVHRRRFEDVQRPLGIAADGGRGVAPRHRLYRAGSQQSRHSAGALGRIGRASSTVDRRGGKQQAVFPCDE